MELATGGNATTGFTYAPESANSLLVFSCGCTSQAGENQLLAGGTFTVPQTSMATPAAPSPTYTSVPGRSYIMIATQNGGGTTEGNGAESWTLEFLGNIPSHNIGLGSGGALTSDVFTAAGALYVYANSGGVDPTAFDGWNFNTILAWVNHMRTAGGLNVPEQTLLNDIAAAQESSTTLFPLAPPWYPALTGNAKIYADLSSVAASGDAALPTPCPGGPGTCTGAPSP